jgi:hypothetical protein
MTRLDWRDTPPDLKGIIVAFWICVALQAFSCWRTW